MSVTIRPATVSDIPAITRIYAHAVAHGTASFELTPPDETEMTRRMNAIFEGGFPYIIAEIGGTVAGYAYASFYRTRPAYRFTVENSVYVSSEMHRQGVGKILLQKLIEECTTRGFRLMVAVIGDSKQLASIGVHEACGFTHAGMIPNIGYKFGRWLDTVLMHLPLGEGAQTAPKDRALSQRGAPGDNLH